MIPDRLWTLYYKEPVHFESISLNTTVVDVAVAYMLWTIDTVWLFIFARDAGPTVRDKLLRDNLSVIVLLTVFTCESDMHIHPDAHTGPGLVTGWEHPPCSSKSDRINITLVRKVIITRPRSCDC